MAGSGDAYRRDGHVFLPGLVSEEIGRALLIQVASDLRQGGASLDRLARASPLLRRDAIELYGYDYAPLLAFLWGLTPAIQAHVGCELLPSYSYFRVYRRGDILRVHSDRPACEHSVSLLLASSDAFPWRIEIADQPATPRAVVSEDFEGASFTSHAMRSGDALLYEGVHRRHGRLTPNPNRWSAHLFLHWVAREGAYAAAAFDGNVVPETVDLALG